MKRPITLPLPKCAKCHKTLEPQFTTEKEEGDDSKPEVLILFGTCQDCNTRTVCNMIKTEDLPNEKELMEFVKQKDDVSQEKTE